MKTAFLIGGFNLHSTAANGIYPIIQKGLEDQGYRVVLIGITWWRKLPSQYLKEFIDIFQEQKTDKNIIIGNSFGAVIAFLAASKMKVDEVYLCSLSPFFHEDRGKFPDAFGIRLAGKKRMNDLWSYSADDIAKSITKTKVHVLYGEKELRTLSPLVWRCRETAKDIKGATLHEIPNAPHDMSDPVYSRAIVELAADSDRKK